MWESLEKVTTLELEKITLLHVAYVVNFIFFCAVSCFYSHSE